MSNGLPSSCRLRKSWEYQRVWEMGCKLHTPHFILLVVVNKLNSPRLGLTVSRKVGNAVKRNRVKRQVREFFRQNKHNFMVPVDLSVVAKKGTATLTFVEIQKQLLRALEFSGKPNG